MSRIGKHGLVYGGGIILSKAVAFIMLPVYTHYLTPADYGLLQLVDMVLEVASIVAGSRLGAGIFRYYHKANTPGKRRAVLSTALIVLVTSYATAATAILVFAPTISDRKSTRLNSSHSQISYAVFCLKKKKNSPRAVFMSCTSHYFSQTFEILLCVRFMFLSEESS